MKQIISASRRTDIPAFHYDWFQQRLKEGTVSFPHPLYPAQTVRVDLQPQQVHSIVLWSKDFRRVAQEPGLLEQYQLYFQFTITAYGYPVEPQVPDYVTTLTTLEQLRKYYTAKQFNIRYDPLLLLAQAGPETTAQGRLTAFRKLCHDLSRLGYGGCRITTSHFSPYGHAVRRLQRQGWRWQEPVAAELQRLVGEMAAVASEYGFSLYSCATEISGLAEVLPGSCIDGRLLEELFGGRVSRAKDSGQRQGCSCSRSRDIGSYQQACGHGCLYCYSSRKAD